MQSPEQRYLSQSVGQQLLHHFAARNAVRHDTPLLPLLPLLPLRLRDIGRVLLALGGRAPRRGHC